MSNVPKLRFKEFSREWENTNIGNIAVVSSGGTPSRSKSSYWNGTIPWVTTSLIDFKDIQGAEEYITEEALNNSSAKLFEKNTILMAMYGQGKTRGKVGILKIQATTNQACASIKPKDTSYIFLYQYLAGQYDNIRNLSNDGGQKNLSGSIIKSIPISIPVKQEQEKIASFLTSVDTKIEQLTKKEELLKQYKKGVMQKIFSQEIRFKADDGREFPSWKKRKLNELMYEHKERNIDDSYTKNDVLSVSGEFGIVNQIEFQGRSFAGASINNYHVVKVNDIVYTKSPLKANPYGIVKVNKKKAGVVSTLYAVYRPKENLNPLFIDYYFQLDDNVNSYFRPLVHKGAKNDMKINNSYAISDSISIPELEEQSKIVVFFQSLDDKIQKFTRQLEATKQFKKALLQQMFV